MTVLGDDIGKTVSEKFVNVRRWGSCSNCHRFRELRAGWNSTLTEIVALCDYCFSVPMDEEAFDLIFAKAGVKGPRRTLVTLQSFLEVSREHNAAHAFTLDKIFPQKHPGWVYAPHIPSFSNFSLERIFPEEDQWAK